MGNLRVNWGDLEMAFEDSSPENSYCLDLRTGEVVQVKGDQDVLVDQAWEEPAPTAEGEGLAPSDGVDEVSVPGWQRGAVSEAAAMAADTEGRYVEVPSPDADEALDDMERFIGTLEDKKLARQLDDAVEQAEGAGAFLEALADHPEVQEQWRAFRAELTRERMLDWLEQIGVEAVEGEEPGRD